MCPSFRLRAVSTAARSNGHRFHQLTTTTPSVASSLANYYRPPLPFVQPFQSTKDSSNTPISSFSGLTTLRLPVPYEKTTIQTNKLMPPTAVDMTSSSSAASKLEASVTRGAAEKKIAEPVKNHIMDNIGRVSNNARGRPKANKSMSADQRHKLDAE